MKVKLPRLAQPSEQTIDRLILFFLILFLSLWPSMRLANIGYVDPNFYIGYSQSFSWLTSSTGYEYHATRLPFIYLLKILLFLPPYLVGIGFKFVLYSVFILAVSKILKQFKFPSNQSRLVLLILGLSPIMISATSWTISQSFATVLSVAFLSKALRLSNSTYEIFLIGGLWVLLALSNLYGATLLLVGFAFLQIRRKSDSTNLLVKFLCASIFWVVLFEAVWQNGMQMKDSLWVEHLKTLKRGVVTEKGFSEWVSIFQMVNNGTVPWLAISLMLSTVLSFWGILYVRKDSNLLITKLALETSLILSLISWLSYVVGVNPQFTSFWYFYMNFPGLLLQFIALCSLTLYRNPIQSSFNLWFISFIFLELAAFSNKRAAPNIVIFIIMSLMYMILIQRKKAIFRWKDLFIPLMAGSIFLAQFGERSLLASYASSTSSQVEFLKAQKELLGIIEEYPASAGEVRAWSASDPTGVAGGLISTIGYHMIRLEGLQEATAQPLSQTAVALGSKEPKYIFLIYPSGFSLDMKYLELCGFFEERSIDLNNVSQVVSIFKKRPQSSMNCFKGES